MAASISGGASAAVAAASSLGTETQPILLGCRCRAVDMVGGDGDGRWHQRFRLAALQLHHCTAAIPGL